MNLNERIATEVMGWEKRQILGVAWYWFDKEGVRKVNVFDWNPENNISHAMQAVEEARKRGIYVEIEPHQFGHDLTLYETNGCLIIENVSFDQLPKAICELILKAVDSSD